MEYSLLKYKKLVIRISFLLPFLLIYFIFTAPLNSKDVLIHVSSGQTVFSLANDLRDKNVIRYPYIFRGFVKILKKGKGIIAGDYFIKKSSPVWRVAWQLGRGYYNIDSIKITIREGLTNEEIANVIDGKLVNFSKEEFLRLTIDKQGYLFPDTYMFFPLDTTEDVIKKLSNNFKRKTDNLELKGKNLNDVIIMASILEGEANGKDDIYVISGILWKRLSIKMPLQVDAERSTYEERGLPSIPINNPGLQSIEAAINPESSPYLYYLHDKNGKVHYAETYEEHRNNINKYL